MPSVGDIYFGYPSLRDSGDVREAARARIVDPGAVPDLAGRALTVQGLKDPSDLGVTLTHEHLFIDLRRNHLPYPVAVPLEGRSEPVLTSEDFPATELATYEAKVGLGNLHLARNEASISDNYVLADEDLAITEVSEFIAHGGSTVVDVTSIGIKRDPEALKRVSEATGLNIVMGTGYYQRVFHPEDMDDRTVEELAGEIVADVVAGVAETGIRSGVIGEIGINGGPITPNEVKSLQAAARASRLTGAPISVHRGGEGAERRETLNILAEEGADLRRVVLGHSDEIASDPDLLAELLDRGVYVEFDLLGREAALTESITSRSLGAVLHLLDAGQDERILLSQDVCWKTHLKHYGGFGYSFILEKALPHLRDNGATEAQVQMLMVENPARLLAFAPPQRA